MRFLKPIASFRSRPEYHNLSYIVAGEVVAKVSGRSWEDFVTERILRPLGMKATLTTYWGRSQLPSPSAATQHVKSDGKVQPSDWQPINNLSPTAGAGGMHSNVVDMVQWLKLQLGEGACDGLLLLRPATIREMNAAHSVSPVAGESKSVLSYPKFFFGYGLGWMLRDYRNRKVVLHTGSSGAIVALMPEESLGIVVLSNLGTGLASMLMHDVFDRYLGLPRPWSTKDWLAEVVEAAEKSAAEAEKKREAERATHTKPSLPLPSYVATYANDLYGSVEIRQDGEGLVLRFGPEMVADLSHWHHDVFSASIRRPRDDRWLVRFVLDAKRQVESAEVQLWDDNETLPLFTCANP
jgi:CubicO group peptidase (beta-lactamase class C family)